MTISALSKEQWKSVAVNALFAGLSAFVLVVGAAGSLTKEVLFAGAVAGLTAAFKVVEKLLTPVSV